ncbi:hypothetical protein C6A85_91325 [Mycobacterium sp. ITM-2017-0098]|nr:hypothetical protein C6A85_91325 [Mycobacterium sp. ITM-2017-0098]
MDMKKLTASVATAGLLGLGGLGMATGLAQADPPANPGNSNGQGNGQGNGNVPRPDVVTGPGVNVGAPGNPLPPGLGYLPPPGHGGPLPQNTIVLPETPAWVITPVLPPVGAPLQPELPDWAEGLSLVWNPDLQAWGVWNGDTGVFIRL